MWDLIVSVPGHCLSFYFYLTKMVVLKMVDRARLYLFILLLFFFFFFHHNSFSLSLISL